MRKIARNIMISQAIYKILRLEETKKAGKFDILNFPAVKRRNLQESCTLLPYITSLES